jgi:hypothetical protein
MFVIGVLPGFAAIWVRRHIDEPAKWAESDRRRREALAAAHRGEQIIGSRRHLTRFTLADLLATPRRVA